MRGSVRSENMLLGNQTVEQWPADRPRRGHCPVVNCRREVEFLIGFDVSQRPSCASREGLGGGPRRMTHARCLHHAAKFAARHHMTAALAAMRLRSLGLRSAGSLDGAMTPFAESAR